MLLALAFIVTALVAFIVGLIFGTGRGCDAMSFSGRPGTYCEVESHVSNHAWLAQRGECDKYGARMASLVTLWQGKFEIVRHENNALRKRLRALSSPGGGERGSK